MVGVGRRRWLSRRGLGRLGCLLWLLTAAVVAYLGVEVGTVYLPYLRLKDAMKTQAQFAPSIDDDTIRRRLLRTVEELDLPEGARQISIRRTARPREIRIWLTYQETVTLPFFTRTITFRPQITRPL